MGINQEIVEKAIKFVREKHLKPSDEQRYGGKPYTFHTNMVASIAVKYIHHIADEDKTDVVISAHGHDLIEDTDCTQRYLRDLFNSNVADIIFRVTNERGFDGKEILFKTLPKIWQSYNATYVKLCDRIANGGNSKNEDTPKGRRMYKKYSEQYPIFRYALKQDNQFEDMWEELDEIFDWKG